MDLQLRDKRSLITGSTSGIGAAIAKALAQEGAIVIVHGRKPEQAQIFIKLNYFTKNFLKR
jgi:3-oxoacyl-[acyl-carrier protein] reductase